MTTFTRADDLRPEEFIGADLRGGLADTGTAHAGLDISILVTLTPSHAEVLEARSDRVAMVRDFLATVTTGQLAEPRRNPHSPGHPETVLSCLHVILEEEWEHRRYAICDLDSIKADSAASTG